LRKWKGNLTIEQIEKTMDSQAPHHWFSGESYPTKEDWLKIKELLGFDDTYDKQMTTIKYKPSEKGETEYTTTLSDCGCNAGFEGGLVYDPFMGTGSTAEVCLRTKRNFIGSEMSEEYVKIAEKRLLPFLIQPTMF
jgi:DNA modification methylase